MGKITGKLVSAAPRGAAPKKPSKTAAPAAPKKLGENDGKTNDGG